MRRAFTLIELMVVVGIMAFLGVAATGGYSALQRGMAERGATAAATSLLQAAKERAMVDRQPTVVFCYNRLLREATADENAVVVGEAVAVRRAGRVSWVQGEKIVDEFADLCNSYDVLADEGEIQQRRGMKLWRFDDARMSDMRYSVVADAVLLMDINGTSYDAWANGGQTSSQSGAKGQNASGSGSSSSVAGNVAENKDDFDSVQDDQVLHLRTYAFYNLNSSSHEPSAWTIGDGYGFEFANVQLPHNFVFGSGAVPSTVGDVAFVKAITFDPTGTNNKGQTAEDDTVDVYFCRPDSSGVPHPANKAGTASSKEDSTI